MRVFWAYVISLPNKNRAIASHLKIIKVLVFFFLKVFIIIIVLKVGFIKLKYLNTIYAVIFSLIPKQIMPIIILKQKI